MREEIIHFKDHNHFRSIRKLHILLQLDFVSDSFFFFFKSNKWSQNNLIAHLNKIYYIDCHEIEEIGTKSFMSMSILFWYKR